MPPQTYPSSVPGSSGSATSSVGYAAVAGYAVSSPAYTTEPYAIGGNPAYQSMPVVMRTQGLYTTSAPAVYDSFAVRFMKLLNRGNTVSNPPLFFFITGIVTIIIGLLLITLIFCLVRNIIKRRRRKALKKFEEASRG